MASSLGVTPNSVNTPLTASLIDGKEGLKFTMAIQNTTFKTGEPVNITFSVTNIGYQTIDYVYGLPEFDFIVYNSSNSQLYKWSSFKVFAMFVTVIHLSPGDSHTGILVWRQTCNQSAYNSEGVQVSPGQYYITGRFLRPNLQTSPLQVSILTD